jgi:hypothetical protein
VAEIVNLANEFGLSYVVGAMAAAFGLVFSGRHRHGYERMNSIVIDKENWVAIVG